jgi:predicted PurR-regulated permease PerM
MNSASYNINITLHVLILFTFLTTFFWLFLSNVEKQNINNVSSKLINNQTKDSLDLIKDNLTKINPKINLNKINLNTVANNLENSSKKPNTFITNHNKKLFFTSIIIIASIFTFLITMIIFYKVFKKEPIDFKHIFLENLIIFSFAGIIEYLFFTHVAIKYIPVTPDVATSAIIDKIKDKFNNNLFK